MEEDSLPALMTQVQSISIADEYQITDQEEAARAADSLQRVNGLQKRLDAAKAAALKPLLDQTKVLRAQWAEPEDLLAKAKQVLRDAIGAWQLKVQNEERLRIQRAEKEAADLKAAAAAREAAAAADARRRAELASEAAAQAAAEGRTVDAAKLEEKAAGHLEKAEIIDAGSSAAIDAAVIQAPAAAAAPKLQGVGTRTRWVGEIRDLRQFLKSVLADEFLKLDTIIEVQQSGLNKLASTFEARLAEKYPGAVGKEQAVVTARSK